MLAQPRHQLPYRRTTIETGRHARWTRCTTTTRSPWSCATTRRAPRPGRHRGPLTHGSFEELLGDHSSELDASAVTRLVLSTGKMGVDAIKMRDELSGAEPSNLLTCKDTYERLRPSTAQQVLRFHRMQQGAQVRVLRA